jgi:mannose-6-phosphate isomerase-like protein (cupin superfamily)
MVEAYFPVRGQMRIACWRGTRHEEYVVGVSDILVVPAGTWHHVLGWVTPGVAYVVRGPNDLMGDAAKIVWDDARPICR